MLFLRPKSWPSTLLREAAEIAFKVLPEEGVRGKAERSLPTFRIETIGSSRDRFQGERPESQIVDLHVLTATTQLHAIVLIDKSDLSFAIEHHRGISRVGGSHLVTGPSGQETVGRRIIGRRGQHLPVDRDMATTLHVAGTSLGIAEGDGLQGDMHRLTVTSLGRHDQDLTIGGVVLAGRTPFQRCRGNRLCPTALRLIRRGITENIEIASPSIRLLSSTRPSGNSSTLASSPFGAGQASAPPKGNQLSPKSSE